MIYKIEFKLSNEVEDFKQSRDYLATEDEPMEEYLPKHLKKKIIQITWRLQDKDKGEIIILAKDELSDKEHQDLVDWIDGQHSDGLGEGFSQQDFSGGAYLY